MTCITPQKFLHTIVRSRLKPKTNEFFASLDSFFVIQFKSLACTNFTSQVLFLILLFRVMLSFTLGTFLEFFDYTLYGYFANTIGHLFFPEQKPSLQLLATWAIFSIGFLIRPLGAAFFGHIADKKGRKKILPLTIALMPAPTILIGLLPTFASIGWFAPLLLLLCRLTQGLAVSAEYNGASIFILENQWKSPGLLAALTPFSCGMGMLAASGLAYLFTHNLSAEFHDMQWRLPFVIAGTIVGFIAWYLRSNLDETVEYQVSQDKYQLEKFPIKKIFSSHKFALITNMICSAYMCSASYLLLVYLSTFLHQEYKMSLSIALLLTSAAAFLESMSALFFGWISDFMGQKKTLFFSSLFTVITALLFILKNNLTLQELFFSLVVFIILLGAFDGPLTLFLPKLFKTNVRYSATTLGYNIGGAAIGGLSPFIMAFILNSFHHPQLALGMYLGTFALLSCSMLVLHGHFQKIRESKIVAINS